MDTVRQHGLESGDFKNIFDVAVTRLHLEPKAELNCPTHIVYNRHKMTNRSTLEPERWLQRISSTEMKAQGVPDMLSSSCC